MSSLSMDESGEAKVTEDQTKMHKIQQHSSTYADSNKTSNASLGITATTKPIHMFCGTFNVNGKIPEDLTKWLLKDNDSPANNDWFKKQLPESFPDLYVIGLEEVVNLNALMYANKVVTRKAMIWENRVHKTITKCGIKYRLIASRQLVGILLIVFARDSLYPFISELDYDTEGVGFLGVGGNKGGVAVRFRVYDSSICLVVSHLAAHKNKCKKRHKNFKEIWENIAFHSRKGTKTDIYRIKKHDFIFWMGDLNYRLDLEDIDEVFDLVEEKEWEKKGDSKLLMNDQLIKTWNQNNPTSQNPISLFQEGPINFPPTYKYVIGTLDYLRVNTKAARFPAWCDRILWKAEDGTVSQPFYRRAPLPWSDHLPVSAMFKVSCSQNDDVTNFLRGFLFSGVLWELIEIFHFTLLHSQLLVPIDNDFVTYYYVLCPFGGALTMDFLDDAVNNTIALDTNAAVNDLTSNDQRTRDCTNQTGMHRYADCLCYVTEDALFRNSLYSLVLLFAIPIGIYILYSIIRFPCKRFSPWFRTYQSKRLPFRTLLGALLEILFIALYALSLASIFEIKRWVSLKDEYYDSNEDEKFIFNSAILGSLAIVVLICCWCIPVYVYARYFRSDDMYLKVYRRSDLRTLYGSLLCDYKKTHRGFFLMKMAYFLLFGIIVSSFSPIYLNENDPRYNEESPFALAQVITLLIMQIIYSVILIVKNPFLHLGYYRFSCAMQILKILSFISAAIGSFIEDVQSLTFAILVIMPIAWFGYVCFRFSKSVYFWLNANLTKCCCPRKNDEYEIAMENIKRQSIIQGNRTTEGGEPDSDDEGMEGTGTGKGEELAKAIMDGKEENDALC